MAQKQIIKKKLKTKTD